MHLNKPILCEDCAYLCAGKCKKIVPISCFYTETPEFTSLIPEIDNANFDCAYFEEKGIIFYILKYLKIFKCTK
jgi:hypothetical protein